MKKTISFLLIATVSLLLFGCSKYPHNASQAAYVYMNGQYGALSDLEGEQMYVVVSHGNGLFAHHFNHDVVYRFDHSGQYQMYKSGSMELLNTGSYVYHRHSKNKRAATLILTMTSGELSHHTLSVNLNYRSSNTGTFNAKLTQGGQGTQTGVFEIHFPEYQ